MSQAATDACSFTAGMGKDGFLQDKRTQQAVIMSLIPMHKNRQGGHAAP